MDCARTYVFRRLARCLLDIAALVRFLRFLIFSGQRDIRPVRIPSHARRSAHLSNRSNA